METTKDSTKVFKVLFQRPENKTCFDCQISNPKWCSPTYGIFLCINCASNHRSFGTHLSFVRSTELDNEWNNQLLARMIVGGNSKAKSFFRSQGVGDNITGRQKYEGKAADLYRKALDKAVSEISNIDQLTKELIGKEDTESKNKVGQKGTSEDLLYKNKTGAKVERRGVQRVSDKFFDDFSDEDEPKKQSELIPEEIAPSPQKSGRLAYDSNPQQAQQQAQRQQPRQQTRNADQNTQTQQTSKIRNNPEGAAAYKHDLFDDEDDKKSKSNVKVNYDEYSRGRSSNDNYQNEDVYSISGGSNHGRNPYGRNEGVRDRYQTDDDYGKNKSRAQEDDWDSWDSRSNNDRDEYNRGRTNFGRNYEDDRDSYSGSNNRDRGDYEDRNSRNYEDRNQNQRNYEDRNSRNNRSFDDWDDKPSSKPSPPVNVRESDFARKNFSSAKSISSDQYFGNDSKEDNYAKSSKLSKFSGASAISSAEYYGRDESDMMRARASDDSLVGGVGAIAKTLIESTGTDYDTLKDSVYQKSTQFVGVAKEWMENIQDRYNF